MRHLPKALSHQSIKDVWTSKSNRDRTPSSAGAPGVDGVRPASFASHLDDQIDILLREIRAGTYRFSKLRIAIIEKENGGKRIIAIPTVRDRLLQRSLLRYLEAAPRFSATSPVSFGFTKGKTLSDALSAALQYRLKHPWVLKVDIVKFFDQIQRADIDKLLRKNVRAKSVAELLCAAVDCELDDSNPDLSEIAKESGIIKGRGLRQGMPVSPMLSNLLLKEFDGALASKGIVAIRYADDVAVFADCERDCLEALSLIEANLAPLGLRVPPVGEGSKTVIRSPSETVEFLGVEIKRDAIGYVLSAPFKKLQKIEKTMAELASIQRCIDKKKTIGDVVYSLDSLIIGYKAAMSVLSNPDEFLSRLEAAKRRQLNTFLTSLIGKKAVEALDATRLAILGLQPFSAASFRTPRT